MKEKNMTSNIILPGSHTSYYANRPITLCSDFYLSGTIGRPEEYIEWFDIIRNANEGDLIRIHINSPGGDLFTAIQFMRVLSDCRGTILTSVEGQCMSAATLIFLFSDMYEVSEHSAFMFHNYSGGSIGKGGEMYEQVLYEKIWSEKLMYDVYGDFLTDKEIAEMMDNKDIWMDGDEVAKRIEKRAKKTEKKMKKLAKQAEKLAPTIGEKE